MKNIAHRGGMRREMQNSPEGVRLAARRGADFVELDVVMGADGTFHCAHGLGARWLLEDNLAEIGDRMELIVHLKGRYEDSDLLRLLDQIARRLSLARVVFASHRDGVLGQLRKLVPDARLGRFGLLPAIAALWKRQPWDYCLINQLVLLKWYVTALQRRGYFVFVSCVWEARSRGSVARLGVDGAFVNL